jgi:hypothetical protein
VSPPDPGKLLCVYSHSANEGAHVAPFSCPLTAIREVGRAGRRWRSLYARHAWKRRLARRAWLGRGGRPRLGPAISLDGGEVNVYRPKR